jgi:hypothetical protein
LPIELQSPLDADHSHDHFREFPNRNIDADANIDVAFAGIVPQQKNQRVRKVVDLQELAPRRSGAPHHDFIQAGQLRCMGLGNEGGNNVRRN